MRALCVVLLLGSGVAAARPRVVLHPTSVPAATAALLEEAAVMPLEFPSTFEVDDAVTASAKPDCASDAVCLASLANTLEAGWAVGVEVSMRDGAYVLSGRLVTREGALVQQAEAGAGPVDAPQWAVGAKALLSALNLAVVGAEPVVAVVAPPEPPKPVVVTPDAPVAPVTTPVVATAAPSSWHRPAAAVVGGLALAAGGAAVALTVINVNDAAVLRESSTNGVIPPSQVARAAALDERTVAAVALGAGAAVAATTAIIFFAAAPSEAPRASVAFGPHGGSVVITGSWP